MPLRRFAIVLLTAGTLLAGCGLGVDQTATIPSPCGLRVAVMGPLSGDSAEIGGNIRAGAELAFAQYNTRRQDCTVDLVNFDSQGDPKQAPALAQQIVDDRRVIGVIGPGFSGETEAAVPILDQAGLTSITTSATRTALTQRGWTTFHRLIGNDAAQGRAAAHYIEHKLAAEAVFVVDDSGSYGRGLADDVVHHLGQRVVQRASVRSQQDDFSAVVAQIRSASADVVFFGGYYAEAGRLQRQLREAGLTPRFVAGDGVKAIGFIDSAGPAAEGAIITCPCLPPTLAGVEFPARYRSMYAQDPGTYAAESYDAAQVFLAGIAAGNTTRPRMEAFVDAYSAQGATTNIRWTPAGELVTSSVTVWTFRIRQGQLVPEEQIPVT